MTRLWICAALLALAGCVGDGVEFGGIEKRAVQPPGAIACNRADLKLVKRGDVYFPGDVVAFFELSDQRSWLERMKIGFDVDAAGQTVNVRYVGPKEALEHGTRQKLIRVVTNSIETSTYSWPGAAGYAAGCEFELTFDWRKVQRAP